MGETQNAVTTVQIKKRNGQVVAFDTNKIQAAVGNAWFAVHAKHHYADDAGQCAAVAEAVAKLNPMSVEEIQDAVEIELMRRKLFDVAKAYIKYRHDRELVRNEKCKILNKTELDEVDKSFSPNSLNVLASRYLLRNEKGEIIETVKECFERVAIHAALPEIIYDPRVFEKDSGYYTIKPYPPSDTDIPDKLNVGRHTLNKYHKQAMVRLYLRLAHGNHIKIEFNEIIKMIQRGEFDDVESKIDEFFNMMVSRDFMPNSPTLMNAGAPLGQLSACFVLGLQDNLPSIMKAATDSAMIFQSGGGIGINYSPLRPAGDIVHSTSGVASGPCSFMNIVNTVTEVVKQGGKRRGANMAILEYNHPDIEQFITMKKKPGVMENFNVSVGMWDNFWHQYWQDGKFQLQNGRTHVTCEEKEAKPFLQLIAACAWESAEPGLIFLDHINRYNPVEHALGPMRCTNPCGEVPLYDYEPCNLGSVNLANFVDDNRNFHIGRFIGVLDLVYQFLDNIIDVNKYPLPEIEKKSISLRRIGIGVMGLADLLSKLRIAYNSKAAFDKVDHLASIIADQCIQNSAARAKERGSFLYYAEDEYIRNLPVAAIHEHVNEYTELMSMIRANGMRNVFQTTIAPTGSISMIADCSNGIEPHFALALKKQVAVGDFYYVNQAFEDALNRAGIKYTDELKRKVAENYGSCQNIKEIPEEIQKSFRTTMDIHWMDHVVMQAVWQKWINNAISKTINMPEDATVKDVESAYLLAHELGCKGITVYRDNSRKAQVLTVEGKRKTTHLFPSDDAIRHIQSELCQSQSQLALEYGGVALGNCSTKDEYRNADCPGVLGPHTTVADSCCSSPNVAMTGGCETCLSCGYSLCHVA